MRHLLAFALPLLMLTACDTTGEEDGPRRGPYVELGTFDIEPRGTYLRTNSDPDATAPLTIDLDSLGLSPGDSLFVRILGEADLSPADSANGQAGAPSFVTIGVFSSSAVLEASDQLNRVPGAIDMMGDYLTGPTAIGALPTDIPEDVLMNRGQFVIPAGATTLFMAPNDQYLSDNRADTYTATLSTLGSR